MVRSDFSLSGCLVREKSQADIQRINGARQVFNRKRARNWIGKMTSDLAFKSYFERGHIYLSQRPPSDIDGWQNWWIARTGSEGTRDAVLRASPVPERLNVKWVFIETPDGPAISWTSLFGYFLSLV